MSQVAPNSPQPSAQAASFAQQQFQKIQFGHDPSEEVRADRIQVARRQVATVAKAMGIVALLSLVVDLGATAWGVSRVVSEYDSMTLYYRGLFKDDKEDVSGRSLRRAKDKTERAAEKKREGWGNALYALSFIGVCLGGFVLMALHTLVLVASKKMAALKSFRLTWTASLFCVIPGLSPLLVAGIPVGIVSLIQLRRRDVRQGFGLSAVSG